MRDDWLDDWFPPTPGEQVVMKKEMEQTPPSTRAADVLLKPYVPATEPFGAERARQIILRGKEQSADAKKAKAKKELPEIPAPEVRGRPATMGELQSCRALNSLVQDAHDAGWSISVYFSRGPWLSADGTECSIRDMLYVGFRWGRETMCVVTYLRADPKMVLKKRYKGTLKNNDRVLISQKWVQEHSWAFESAWVRGEYTAVKLNAGEVGDWLVPPIEDEAREDVQDLAAFE